MHWPVHWDEDEQDTPGPHKAHLPPPQSPPGASSACAIPSEHDGAAQKPAVHDLETQSDPREQGLPTEQRLHPEDPPQSIPASPPF